MRRAFRLLAALILVAAALLFWSPAQTVTLVEEESWFSDFSVEDGLVTISTLVTLKNTTDTDATVSLAADFSEDVQGGLLAEARLQGKSADGGTTFKVPAKSAASFAVTFEGASGGAAHKHDRLLPEIEITVIE